MKTTVEVDEHKLERVMELCQIATQREAIDRALTELERQASFKQVLSRK
jgi:Arc/MetJ family transcription regulator